MTTAIEYALMAGASYISTRRLVNRFPIPQGWAPFFPVPDPSTPNFPTTSGFEAVSFAKGTEIAISYAGTYPKNPNGDLLPIPPFDIAADIGLAFGTGSVQLTQAVDYYLQVKAANPGATITLTGHSLGGGLASLVSVFFGVPATTFDQAPFANSAQDPSITASLNPLNFLFGAPDIAANLKQYLQSETFITDAPDVAAAKAAARDAMVQQLDSFLAQRQANGGIPNSNLVNNIRVDGEFLSSLPIGIYDTIGNAAPADVITHGPYNDPSMDLHAQSLLTAFLQSDATAATDATGQKHNLSEASKKLTGLLGMIFDPNLYSLDTDKEKENLLERLVRHEAGNAPLPGGGMVSADAMVTRFTADLWKLAQDGGLTLSDWPQLNGSAVPRNVSQALIAFAMQMYYEDTANATNASKQLFTDLGTGGIRFDITDTYSGTPHNPSTPANEFKPGLLEQWQNGEMKLDAKDASGNYLLKGYQYLQQYLTENNAPNLGAGTFNFTAAERQLITAMLPVLRDWYVQAGASGMTATDTLNRGAFMLGSNGADTLTGGTAADLLVGNAGDDILKGGQGGDTLLGGIGVDTYAWQSGQNQGIDTILDSDNTGYLRDDTPSTGSGQASPIVLTGGEQYGDGRVFRGKDANGASHLYTFVTGDKTSGGDLIVDGAMLIKDYRPGAGNHMGITLGAAVADVNPTTTRDITGDFGPKDFTDANGNIVYHYDDLNNLVTDPAKGGARADNLNDSTGNDLMQGLGGGDILKGGAGSDYLDDGAGVDELQGGAGADILVGGDVRMRWRLIAANDKTTHVWRGAA